MFWAFLLLGETMNICRKSVMTDKINRELVFFMLPGGVRKKAKKDDKAPGNI